MAISRPIGLSSQQEAAQLVAGGLKDDVVSSISQYVQIADPATNAIHPANVVILPQS
jgi:hypothetical protein